MLTCIKYIVIIYNFIFWLLGVAILGVTVFLYVDSQNYVNFEDTSELYMTPFLLLMALGAMMTLVGFLGCCGAVRESTCILGTYFFLCTTMCVACGAAVWWSTEHGQVVKDRVQNDILKVIKEKYGRGTIGATDTLIDAIQNDFGCCGVKGPNDWASSLYNQHKPNKTAAAVTGSEKIDFGIARLTGNAPTGTFKVPPSCCIKHFPDCEKARSNLPLGTPDQKYAGINRDGCVEKVDHYIDEQWQWLMIVAMILIGVQGFALLFACCLCCAISRAEDK